MACNKLWVAGVELAPAGTPPAQASDLGASTSGRPPRQGAALAFKQAIIRRSALTLSDSSYGLKAAVFGDPDHVPGRRHGILGSMPGGRRFHDH